MASDDSTTVQVTFAEIEGKFDQIMQGMDVIKEKQDEMAEDISEIKSAVYDPDSGLYARLRELESWKATSSRLIWILITAVVSLGVATVYKSL